MQAGGHRFEPVHLHHWFGVEVGFAFLRLEAPAGEVVTEEKVSVRYGRVPLGAWTALAGSGVLVFGNVNQVLVRLWTRVHAAMDREICLLWPAPWSPLSDRLHH